MLAMTFSVCLAAANLACASLLAQLLSIRDICHRPDQMIPATRLYSAELTGLT